MKRLLTAVLLIGTLGVGGCITEPAPEEPTVYGKVTHPKKAKRPKKAAKKQVITQEAAQ